VSVGFVNFRTRIATCVLFAQSLSTTAHALFPVPAWRVGDGASASATRILYWRQWRFGGGGIAGRRFCRSNL
jgi:hypothetical protein